MCDLDCVSRRVWREGWIETGCSRVKGFQRRAEIKYRREDDRTAKNTKMSSEADGQTLVWKSASPILL